MDRGPVQRRRWCSAVMLIAVLLTCTPIAMAGPQPVASPTPPNPDAAPNGFQHYLVEPAAPSEMVIIEARGGTDSAPN